MLLPQKMQKEKIHMSIIVDEYGQTEGLVCMEDIIEEIVGDIQDEFDHEREDIISLSDNVWICDDLSLASALLTCRICDSLSKEGIYDSLYLAGSVTCRTCRYI